MTGFVRASLVLLLCLSVAASAHGGVVVASYYYPVYYQPTVTYYTPTVAYYPPTVTYYAPVWPVYTTPVVCPPAVTYAMPTAAPPSQTIEPPLGAAAKKFAPTVTESRTDTGPAMTPKVASPAVVERVQVGFWNVTGRDVTLIIDGQTRVLPRNRNLTVTVGRQFVWRVDQGVAQTERIPDGQWTAEIVV